MPSAIVSSTLQASVLSATSNILAQVIDAYRGQHALKLDTTELFRFVLLTIITAPPNFLWQQLLERTFPGYPIIPSKPDVEKAPEKREDDPPPPVRKLHIRNTITKWFIDCMTIGALLNTLAFFTLMGILKGQSTQQIQKNIQTETIPLIVTGYRVWPIVSIISFSFVPVEKRIVFFSIVGLFWGIYMSFIAKRV